MGVSYHSRYAAPQISPAPKPGENDSLSFWALPDRFHSSSRIGMLAAARIAVCFDIPRKFFFRRLQSFCHAVDDAAVCLMKG